MVHYGVLGYYLVLPIALAAIYLSELQKNSCIKTVNRDFWLEFHLLFMVFLDWWYRALDSKSFGLPVGETALAGSVVLAIMALPTIIYLN
jgi:phosphate transport system permease protein